MRVYSSLHKLISTALLLACLGQAHAADEFPQRAIKIIVSQQAGGGTDNLARMWAESVGKTLNVPIVVENKPGAGGVIAAKAVLSQPANGYTLFLAGVSQMVLNKFVYKPLSYSPEKDFAGIGMLTTVPFVLAASPQSGFNNYDDLQKAAKSDPEKITFASSGNGNSTHLVVEMLMKQAGFKMLHIPYRGEPDSIVSTVGGNTQIVAPVLSSALPLIKEGKLKPLLVFNDSRVPELPDVPTAGELGLKGFENIGWSAVAAKAGTPEAVIRKLHAATQTFLNDPAAQEKFAAVQVRAMPGPSSALIDFTVRDTAKWQEAVGDLNLNVK
ncbi:MAG: Bug family tripartite tricarboxylate transporter substrate binding protein [Advenella sp.]